MNKPCATIILFLLSLQIYGKTIVTGKGAIKSVIKNTDECAYCIDSSHPHLDNQKLKIQAILNAKKQCNSEVDRISEWTYWGFNSSNEYVHPPQNSYTHIIQANFECLIDID